MRFKLYFKQYKEASSSYFSTIECVYEHLPEIVRYPGAALQEVFCWQYNLHLHWESLLLCVIWLVECSLGRLLKHPLYPLILCMSPSWPHVRHNLCLPTQLIFLYSSSFTFFYLLSAPPFFTPPFTTNPLLSIQSLASHTGYKTNSENAYGLL